MQETTEQEFQRVCEMFRAATGRDVRDDERTAFQFFYAQGRHDGSTKALERINEVLK